MDFGGPPEPAQAAVGRDGDPTRYPPGAQRAVWEERAQMCQFGWYRRGETAFVPERDEKLLFLWLRPAMYEEET